MQKNTMDMTSGSLFKKIIAFALPIMLTGVLQLLFNAADLVIVGRFCGSLSVAAVGATTSLTHLLVNFFIGISTGTGVTVAHAIGSKDEKEIFQTVHTAIPTALISGLLVSVIGVAFSKPMLCLMGVPENVLNLSVVYIKIYFCGAIFNIVYNFGAAILRAAGDSKTPLVFLTLAGVINVILNIIFVTAFNMNVAGVALATTISQAVSAVLVLIALQKRSDATKLYFKKIKIKKKILAKLLKIGIPSGIQSSLFSLSNVIIQSSVNSFGDLVISGCAASSSIEGFPFTILDAFNHTALNFSGQNMGAGRFKRIKKTFFICCGYVTVIGIAFGILFTVFSKQLLSIYLPDAPQAIKYGQIRLTYITLTYFICGLMGVATGCIRGMGSSFVTMLITVAGVCGFRIFWIYTIFAIERFHTLESIFISYPISWILSFTAQAIAFAVIYKKKTRAALSGG